MALQGVAGFLNALIRDQLLSLTKLHLTIFQHLDFFFSLLSIDLIQFEAIDESQQNEPLSFSNDEYDEPEQDDNFIDDSEQPVEDISFYKQLDPENINHYNKFPNQSKNPIDAVYEDDEMFFGDEDTQPELFAPEDRESVEFDKFVGFENLSKNSKIQLKILKTVTAHSLIQ